MQKLNSAMTSAVMLLVCVTVSASVVRADESGDESSVAAMVKTLVALTDTLKAKTDQHAHVQLTTGGEVVELVSAVHVKASSLLAHSSICFSSALTGAGAAFGPSLREGSGPAAHH